VDHEQARDTFTADDGVEIVKNMTVWSSCERPWRSDYIDAVVCR